MRLYKSKKTTHKEANTMTITMTIPGYPLAIKYSIKISELPKAQHGDVIYSLSLKAKFYVSDYDKNTKELILTLIDEDDHVVPIYRVY